MGDNCHPQEYTCYEISREKRRVNSPCKYPNLTQLIPPDGLFKH